MPFYVKTTNTQLYPSTTMLPNSNEVEDLLACGIQTPEANRNLIRPR